MKKIIILGLFIFLTGCGIKPTPTTESDKNNPLPKDTIKSESIQSLKEGEECGAIKDKKCGKGMECKYDQAEKKGFCRETIADKEMQCPKEQKPVCAVKDKNKNGYLNACEAERHGASIINEGFCKKNDRVPGNCHAYMESMGNCETLQKGIEFNGELCEEIEIYGCDADIPFTSKEDCEATCLSGEKNSTEANNNEDSTEVETSAEVNEDGEVKITLPKIEIDTNQ